MKLNVSLKSGDKKIVDDILNIMIPELNSVFSAVVRESENSIKQILSEKIRSEPVYASLISGRLRYEFGIPRASAINSVVDDIVNTVSVRVIPIKKTSRNITGGLDITLVNIGSNILQNKNAVVNDMERGYVLPWLKWLLFDGSSPIIVDYHVEFGQYPKSRTGRAIMAKGGRWGISTQYAGVESNNWLTRSVSKSRDQIVSIISSKLKRRL